MTSQAEMLEQLVGRIPADCEWSTGTGTKQSHAQILAPWVRRHSFYAVADTEAEALEMAVAELEAALRATKDAQ